MIYQTKSAGLTALSRLLPKDVLPDEGVSSTVQAVGFVKRSLLENQLQPGERVSIDEIAKRLGISRTPVREAMHRLEGEGLIVSTLHRGYVVRKLERADIAILSQARLCIEPFAAMAVTRNNTQLIEDLTAIQEQYRQLLETNLANVASA